MTREVEVSIARLPATGRDLFGREAELAWLDDCWRDGVHVASVVAWGGVGKTALVNRWLAGKRDKGWDGAQRVYLWSFYNQGMSRLGSSDEFIDAALREFGDSDPTQGSPWGKGERLARLMRKDRTLLLLDGLELMQWGPGVQEGKLKDPALEALVKVLGAHNNGLCLLTSRIAITDLDGLGGDKVRSKDLGSLSPEAGANLLKARGAKGTDEELREAARDYKGHGLALTLLGSYLEDVANGDIRWRKEIGPLTKDERQGGHAQRVMTAYEAWLGRPEVAILRMIGLFDRPVDDGELTALRTEPLIPGLTDALVGVEGRAWNKAVAKLRRAGLLLIEQDNRLDAHPLVREHFGQQLKQNQPEAWREGHRRLYVYLKEKAEPLPGTIEEMALLYAAVMHGCLAGQYQETLDQVYRPRIQRDDNYFNVKSLGAFSAQSGVLCNFFREPWTQIVDDIKSTKDQAFILSETGYCLKGLGRVAEAMAGPMLLALKMRKEHGDSMNAAIASSNMADAHLVLGDVALAVRYAEMGLAYALNSREQEHIVSKSVGLARAAHYAGDFARSATLFESAERAYFSQCPPSIAPSAFLLGIGGLFYCDLLVDQGRFLDAELRVVQSLEVAKGRGLVLDIALSHLAIAQAHLARLAGCGKCDTEEAMQHIHACIEILAQTSRVAYHGLLGLLARAALHTHTHDFPAARHDLDETLTLATRCGFRLHETDAHLGYARLALAEGTPTPALAHLAKARRIIDETGYHRPMAS